MTSKPHIRLTHREAQLEQQVRELESQVHGLSSLVADKLMQIDCLEEQLQASRASAFCSAVLAQKGNVWRHELQDAHREVAGLKEQLDATRVALDRGAADYVGLLEQLEALKADNERLRSRLTYLLIDPNPLTPEELENLRERAGLPRVPNPATSSEEGKRVEEPDPGHVPVSAAHPSSGASSPANSQVDWNAMKHPELRNASPPASEPES